MSRSENGRGGRSRYTHLCVGKKRFPYLWRGVMTEFVPRGPKGKRRYAMDYIADPTLYKAVMFARQMMREGTQPSVANCRAAQYYHVPVPQVAHYTGQAAGTCAQRKRVNR